jgi:hypothetical protein
MIFSEQMLSKYAAARRGQNAFEKWEAELGPKERHERELVRRAQNGDFMAMKEILMLYNNVVQSSIRDSGLISVMDRASAEQEAINALKKIVLENIDLTKQTVPNTYIYGQLPNMMRTIKYENRDFAARKSSELTRHTEAVVSAESFLEKKLGRLPTSSEAMSYIKNNFDFSNKINKKQIERIQAYNRRELSGNVLMGAEGDGENLTFADVLNVDKRTPGQYMEDTAKLGQVEDAIGKLPDKKQRRLIRSFYGLGEYKGRKASSLNDAAMISAMSYYDANKTLDQFRDILKKEGLI